MMAYLAERNADNRVIGYLSKERERKGKEKIRLISNRTMREKKQKPIEIKAKIQRTQ